LDIRGLFNPVDCRSIGTIRDELNEIGPGEILEVQGNRFQQREIEAWCRKFTHPVVQATDEGGLVKLWIEKGGPK
jgi:TusA-related sulfurtransferase